MGYSTVVVSYCQFSYELLHVSMQPRLYHNPITGILIVSTHLSLLYSVHIAVLFDSRYAFIQRYPPLVLVLPVSTFEILPQLVRGVADEASDKESYVATKLPSNVN